MGDGIQSRSIVYVTDFVEGVLAAAKHSFNCDSINLATDEQDTIQGCICLPARIT